MKRIVFIINLVFIYSCDKVDTKLVIHNTSNDTVFFYVKNNSVIDLRDQPFFYSNPNMKDIYKYEFCLFLNEQENCEVINDTWEERISRIPDGKIKIIIFKKQLLDTTRWERIVNEQLYSKLIERDVEDLRILNWVVEYDGK
jgi:hypothetical protein